jgi:hypothetical protein
VSLSPLYSSSAFAVTAQENLSLLVNLDQNSLGQTSQLVSTAVRQLCGLFLPNDELDPIRLDEYYDVAKDYYEQIKRADPTGKQCLMFLSYSVHSILSCPFGPTPSKQTLHLFN